MLHLNAGILSAGIKQGTLLFELPSYMVADILIQKAM
jgi:hypothetical protein